MSGAGLSSHFHVPRGITRCSNNYGPYQFPEKVIPLFVTNLIEGKKVPLYGDGLMSATGCMSGSFVTRVDVLTKGRPGEVYNIGGNNEVNNKHAHRNHSAD